MDASASLKKDAEIHNLCSFYVKIENAFPTSVKQKSSIIKYTRLPEYDFSPIEKWPKNSYSLEPRLRRIISIEKPLIGSTRSLKTEMAGIPKMASTGYSKRKIVTIDEDDENSLHPKFSREIKGSFTKVVNRALETKDLKQSSQRSTSRLINSTKYSQDVKQSNKTSPTNNTRRNVSVSSRNKQPKENDPIFKGKESSRNTKSINAPSKTLVGKKLHSTDSGKEIQIFRNKIKQDSKSTSPKKIASKEKCNKIPLEFGHLKNNLLRELSDRKKQVNVIHVPLEKDYDKNYDYLSQISKIESEINKKMVDSSTDVEDLKVLCDVNIGTESVEKIDKITTTVTNFNESTSTAPENKDYNTFENLQIPNVTLIRDKCEKSKENLVSFCSQSVPNLIVPLFSVTSMDKDNAHEKPICKSSYIISRATLTYTTEQKIDIHMVKNNVDMNSPPNTVNYPMNVMSVYKKELKEQTHINKKKNAETENSQANTEPPKDIDNNRLIKPSEIISSMNTKLLQNDYINEQFQRELNFIDSFFESLQYLENYSFSHKRLSQCNVEKFVNNTCNLKKLEYDSFFSKFDHSHVDDSETIASKSLCLLNLLIRDEQRRAKNFLFVLKMREDALKDFTKSQILWLENRKKQDNTDISTLKKKQRGALLKLQHECGEMQRMRKALLALSEKRKIALMKTKRNIELKFRKQVDVEQILEKRKLKRSISADRNTAPLKCFDLSSSGCEESSTSRPKSVTPLCILKPVINPQSAEKSIQTGDSILSITAQTSTAEENFVVVDGGYLNILFQNLTLPEIFSSSKQYEVNEEALKNIVTTTNNKVNDKGDAIKNFMDHVKSHVCDTSSPSTARSLVEEFDQYYKGLNSVEKGQSSNVDIHEVKDVGTQMVEEWIESPVNSEISDKHDYESVEPCMVSVETQCIRGRDDSIGGRSVAGPLPVPAGEAAATENTPDLTIWPEQRTSSTSTSPDENSSVDLPDVYTSPTAVTTLAQNEADELRRQQLAIEKEIKALEQQQCRLLVREIPDKPPPPYTPPAATRAPKPKKFTLDEASEEKVQKYLKKEDAFDSVDPFDAFLKDYCDENVEHEKKEKGDKFWDTCHGLPKKRVNAEKSASFLTAELTEVLTGVRATVVTGVGARRSDHIDDILFAEWRRCEPEWTSLHTDEVIVKNQIFESIFQKILTETVDEYKKSAIVKRVDKL
ncbi:uncharacterized protein LOC110997382 [Pieris rapae]|uniref:uncharacterized protein LOC110997382 n=1 Tax=Pieris rapae TaxID=64459 RepID=UPI001E27E858|nr:uncharacterized protein LOC110997382 [Pieris rapae]